MISVIIPVYNVDKYLSRCIESVINQTYQDLEIILVNDGSTDSIGSICDEYAKKDSRITVIHKENGGLSDARNSGLDIAKGEYIGFIDSDDFVSLNFYEILYNKLIETNSDLSFCRCQRFSDIKEINKNTSFSHTKVYTGYDFIETFFYEKSTVHYVVLCDKLYKRHIWETLRFPVNIMVCEDEFVWYKCMYNAGKICEIDAELYYYFKREDSITNKEYGKYSYTLELVFIEALKDRMEFCKENNLNQFFIRTDKYRTQLLRRIYLELPKDRMLNHIEEELQNNMKNIPFIKRIKIYLKKYF